MDPEGELEALTRLMPPPDEPLDSGEPDGWPAIELQLGLPLPSDYKAFIAAYGSGNVGDFITIFNPFSENPNVRLLDAAEANLQIYREIRQFEDIPFPIHPERGGLVPFADTYNGDVLFWVADPPDAPDEWSIAVGEVRGPGWYRHPGPLVRFCREWLTREAIVPFMLAPPSRAFRRAIPWPELQARIAADQAKWRSMKS